MIVPYASVSNSIPQFGAYLSHMESKVETILLCFDIIPQFGAHLAHMESKVETMLLCFDIIPQFWNYVLKLTQ